MTNVCGFLEYVIFITKVNYDHKIATAIIPEILYSHSLIPVFCFSCGLFIVNPFHCQIYKLNFVLGMFTCENHSICIGFNTVCSFIILLAVRMYIPHGQCRVAGGGVILYIWVLNYLFIHTFIMQLLFRPGTSAKLRLLVQHDINTLRGQEKHGLQPALLVHWAKCLQRTVSSFMCILFVCLFLDLGAQG